MPPFGIGDFSDHREIQLFPTIRPCYNTSMRKGIKHPITLSATVALAVATIGCGNKAPEPIAPLAAAVGNTPATPPASTSTAAAPAQPEPFSLKPGEQLVPHTVAKGESLWVLAQKYNTRVSRIKSANNMTSDLINEGRTLQIPTTGGGAAASDPVAVPAPLSAPAAPATAAPAPPSLFQPAAPAPTPAPAPAAPATGAAPSLNFGTPPPAPAPAAPAPTSGGIKFQDN